MILPRSLAVLSPAFSSLSVSDTVYQVTPRRRTLLGPASPQNSAAAFRIAVTSRAHWQSKLVLTVTREFAALLYVVLFAEYVLLFIATSFKRRMHQPRSFDVGYPLRSGPYRLASDDVLVLLSEIRCILNAL